MPRVLAEELQDDQRGKCVCSVAIGSREDEKQADLPQRVRVKTRLMPWRRYGGRGGWIDTTLKQLLGRLRELLFLVRWPHGIRPSRYNLACSGVAFVPLVQQCCCVGPGQPARWWRTCRLTCGDLRCPVRKGWRTEHLGRHSTDIGYQ